MNELEACACIKHTIFHVYFSREIESYRTFQYKFDIEILDEKCLAIGSVGNLAQTYGCICKAAKMRNCRQSFCYLNGIKYFEHPFH